MTPQTTTMFTYSARKNSANDIELYSVWYPATSSCSASGKSKGARLVSAMPATKKMKKPTGARNTYHFGTGRTWKSHQAPACASTISRSDSEFAITSTDARAIPYASS